MIKNLSKYLFKLVLFIIINYNNQEKIYHIHYFECIFYHQRKTTNFCWFYKFAFYNFYFESYSSNVSSIYFLTICLIVAKTIFSMPFFMVAILIEQKPMSLCLLSNMLFDWTPAVLSFILQTISLFESLIFTKVKHFFSVA